MDIGIVRPVRIEDEMKGAYLDYAMSVITARALPDARDGLKPVQRRILYSMDELGLRHTSAYKKSARIVGEVMGKYHPHGDSPVYEAMVRMAQDFSMRYRLVDGQGNFGSVDGDPPAAMRYTEARLAAIAEEMLADIDKNTVDFAPNFDDTLKEPRVLPSKLPNLLVNGSSGIAVGMATNIPPHNLGEVVDAATYIIGRLGEGIEAGVPFSVVWGRAFGAPVDLGAAAAAIPKLKGSLKDSVAAAAAKLSRRPSGDQQVQALIDVVDDLIDVPPDKLMEMVKGPDFPTAGIILGSEGIKNAYATGHGRITIRARAHTEDMRGGRSQIVVTELPFQVNKAALLEKIAELVRDRRVDGISDMRDESDRQGMRVVIELRREAQPRQVLNQLYKYTAMQTTFSVNLLALVDGQPRVLTLKLALLQYLSHRREVITRRTEFDLAKARHRAHILEGLKIALDHLDEVIAMIRRSKDTETARASLMKTFKLSQIQAEAILDMQLRRLAALERQKILDEYAQTLKLIARLEDLLANPVKILFLIRDELVELKTKYGDERRTRILAEEAAEFTDEDLIPDQEIVVTLSAKGYLRRVLADGYRLQRRGSKSIAGTISREDDPPMLLATGSTRDDLLLFSNRGRAYQMRMHDVPEATRQARGLPASNFVSLDEQERVVAMLPLNKLEGRYIVFATGRGEVKRVAATEYASVRGAGIIGLAVPDGDELLGAVATDGRQEVMLATAKGQAIRFQEAELRASGRASGGVRGIKLGDGDLVISLDVAGADGTVVVVTVRGFGKRSALEQFSTQGRGGGGIKAAAVTAKNGELVALRVAMAADDLIVVTGAGTVLRAPVQGLPEMGRSKPGQPIIKLERDDKVVFAGIIAARDKPPAGSKNGAGRDGSDEVQGEPVAPNGQAGASDLAGSPSPSEGETKGAGAKARRQMATAAAGTDVTPADGAGERGASVAKRETKAKAKSAAAAKSGAAKAATGEAKAKAKPAKAEPAARPKSPSSAPAKQSAVSPAKSAASAPGKPSLSAAKPTMAAAKPPAPLAVVKPPKPATAGLRQGASKATGGEKHLASPKQEPPARGTQWKPIPPRPPSPSAPPAPAAAKSFPPSTRQEGESKGLEPKSKGTQPKLAAAKSPTLLGSLVSTVSHVVKSAGAEAKSAAGAGKQKAAKNRRPALAKAPPSAKGAAKVEPTSPAKKPAKAVTSEQPGLPL